MDDPQISVPADRCVIRQCEVSRLQSQLLAQAYQQVFPQALRPLVQAKVQPPRASDLQPHFKAAAVAAGA